MGIEALYQKPNTSRRREGNQVYPYLLRDLPVLRSNQVWACDITYIPTGQGWLYLAAVLDLHSRRIVGWALDQTMTTDLVRAALEMALGRRQPAAGLLHHTDRGSQYTSAAYQDLLMAHELVASLSGTGHCYDNAPMESFFGTLKAELIYRTTYATRAAARQDIVWYIEGFYNATRRQAMPDAMRRWPARRRRWVIEVPSTSNEP